MLPAPGAGCTAGVVFVVAGAKGASFFVDARDIPLCLAICLEAALGWEIASPVFVLRRYGGIAVMLIDCAKNRKAKVRNVQGTRFC